MGKNKEHGGPAGPFWSGTITFGLVSIQVDLYPAHRPKVAALRMVDQNGVALHRRYFCPRDHKPVSGDEIVRGYEIAKDEYIMVSDDELEALEPEKSREIDLRSFVAVSELDPVYFQHAYFLIPAGSVNKAYRLLAEIMERSGRAGIGTFVMKDREHLVAILSEDGILRAETLLFADEIRAPETVGLPPLEKGAPDKVKQLQQEIKKRFHRKFDQKQLSDRYARQLFNLVRRKLKSGEDVVVKPAEAEAEGAEIIDLMEIIKKRFKQPASSRQGGGRSKAGKKKVDLAAKSKPELYEEAQRLDIAGRSSMTKDELIKAIIKSS